MKVSIKGLNVDMDVKNRGVEFDVYSNEGAFFGRYVRSKKRFNLVQRQDSEIQWGESFMGRIHGVDGILKVRQRTA